MRTRGHPPRRLLLPSVFGDGMLERTRSTFLGMLGLTAAMGLGVIALALQMSWPIAGPQPLPSAPHQAVGRAVAVAAPRSPKRLSRTHPVVSKRTRAALPARAAAPPVPVTGGATEAPHVETAPPPTPTHDGGGQAPQHPPAATRSPAPPGDSGAPSAAPPPQSPPAAAPQPVVSPPAPEPPPEESKVPGNGNANGKGNGNGPPKPPPAVGNPHTDGVDPP